MSEHDDRERANSGTRPRSFETARRLPLVGRTLGWGMGGAAAWSATRKPGARIAGLKSPSRSARTAYRPARSASSHATTTTASVTSDTLGAVQEG